MDKLEKLTADLAAIDANLDALCALDALTEAQEAEFKALEIDRKKAVQAIDREKGRLAREAERQALDTDAERARRTQLANPSGPQTSRDVPRLPAQARAKLIKLANGCEVEEAWLADPCKGFSTHVDFLKAVMIAGRTGRVDKRLAPLASINRLEDEAEDENVRGSDYVVPQAFTPSRPAVTGFYNSRGRQITAGSDEHGTYSDPYGGFLVNKKSMLSGILSTTFDGDPVGPLTTKIPMATPTVGVLARVDKNHTSSVSGGLRVYRTNETQSVSSSRMEHEEVELKASALMGVAYATEQLLARSLVSFLAVLSAGFADEFVAKLMTERLEGTGVGQYEGVLNTPCIVPVAKETGQAADTIMYANVIKMRARAWRYGNCIWLANHDCLPQLMQLSLQVGTGGAPVWQPSASPDHPDMLLGRPIYFNEWLPTVGDTGDLLLANWSQYLEGTLTPMQSDESMHVRFLEHERTFKFWTENAGRCWWRSALTPRKSASTLSPFVKLDARA